MLRSILYVCSVFYGIAVFIRNRLYDIPIFKIAKVDAVVVSVGNITTGGTGKTPLVAWLSNYFTSHDIATAVLTRGYKVRPLVRSDSTRSDFADEPVLLARTCPKAKIMINPDRAAAAKKAISEYDVKLLIMDDGFQHRRLARNVDIVAIDATNPFGCEKLLPAGFLREPVSSLKRAGAVVVTRINQNTPEKIQEIKRKISEINPDAVFATAIHNPRCAKLIKDREISLKELAGKKVYAFCGIGNPEAFFQMLDELALNIVGTRVYNDHHSYAASDIGQIVSDSRCKQAEIIITTQKDWLKTALLCMEQSDIPVAFLAVEIEFITGQEEIITLIESAIKKK